MLRTLVAYGASPDILVDAHPQVGHVERRVNPQDRRARALRLSARGQALHDRLRAAARASQERILAPLAPTERTLFLDMLTRLVEVHEAYARPGNGRRRAPGVAAPIHVRSVSARSTSRRSARPIA